MRFEIWDFLRFCLLGFKVLYNRNLELVGFEKGFRISVVFRFTSFLCSIKLLTFGIKKRLRLLTELFINVILVLTLDSNLFLLCISNLLIDFFLRICLVL